MPTKWASVRKRIGWRRVSPSLKKKLLEWILNHPHIIPSPIAKDAILIPDPNNPKQKIRTNKLLLQIPIRELHNDLLNRNPMIGLPEARDKNDKTLISDTGLRGLMPSNVRKMTNQHKQMCGCKQCTLMDFYHSACLQFQSRLLTKMNQKVDQLQEGSAQHSIANAQRVLYCREVRDSEGNTRFPKPRDAAMHVSCKAPDSGNDDKMLANLTHFHCANIACTRCPDYKIPDAESRLDADDAVFQYASSIKFHTYEKGTRCSHHGSLNDGSTSCHFVDDCEGKIQTRDQLVKKEMPLDIFLTDYYLPQLQAYKLHQFQFIILSKAHMTNPRHESLKTDLGEVATIRDFAEALSLEHNQAIQSDHWGVGWKVSMEGVAVYFPMHGVDPIIDFHTYLSDSTDQSSATVYNHMTKLVKLLKRPVY